MSIVKLASPVQKITKASLHKTVQRFDMLNNATGEGIWDYELATGKTFYNENISSLFGYTPAEMEQNKSWWEGNLHPQDKSRVINSLNNTLLANIDVWKGQYLFRCKDGNYKPVHERIYIVRDGAGNPERIIGTMQDMDDNSTTAAAQQQHHKKHIQSVIKNIIRADETERRQMGDELHENINQVLATINFYIENAKKTGNAEAGYWLSTAQDLIKETIKGISKVSYQLAPLTLQLLGVTNFIQERLEKLKQTKGIISTLSAPENLAAVISDKKQLLLYRIITIQLENICKHAKATHVLIKLTVKKGLLTILIEDNGNGFDAAKLKYGGGFSKLQHFATAYKDGSFSVAAQPGAGCQLEITI